MAGPNTGCGCMTSRTGCLVIAWLELVFLSPVIIAGVTLLAIGSVGDPVSLSDYHPKRWDLMTIGIVLIAVGTLNTIAPACLLHGATKGKPAYVMGYGVCAILKSFATFISIFAAIVFADAATIGGLTLSLPIDVYKATVVFCHYNYLSQQRRELDSALQNMAPHKIGFSTVETSPQYSC